MNLSLKFLITSCVALNRKSWVLNTLTLGLTLAHSGYATETQAWGMSYVLPVAQIFSTFVGNGIPVIVSASPLSPSGKSQDSVYILTNSHVLAGAGIAKVALPYVSETVFDATTAIDWPLHDVALLKLQASDHDLAPVAAIAKKVIRFQSFAQVKSGYTAFKIKSVFQVPLVSWLTPKRDPNGNVLGFFGKWDFFNGMSRPKVIPGDEIISGLYSKILELPAALRPGMSGSPLFEDGKLRGMLAKVSYSFEARAYAIPIDEIAKLINIHFFGHPNPYSEINSGWDIQEGSPTLWVELQGKRFFSEPFKEHWTPVGGGAVGNSGGGAVGNSGGVSLTDSIWKLALWGHVDEILNPFTVRSSTLRDAKESYSILVTPSSRFAAATLARVVAQTQKTGKIPVLLPAAQSTKTALLEKRIRRERKWCLLNSYTKKLDHFEMHIGTTGIKMSDIQMSNSTDHYLDLGFDFRSPDYKSAHHAKIQVSSDLSKITISQKSGKKGRSETLTLSDETISDSPTLKYGTGRTRAVLAFKEDDLVQLEKILILVDDLLFDVILCDPQFGPGERRP